MRDGFPNGQALRLRLNLILHPGQSSLNPSCRSLLELCDRSKLDELTIQELFRKVLQVLTKLKEDSRDPLMVQSVLYLVLLQGAPFLVGAMTIASALWIYARTRVEWSENNRCRCL